MLALSVVRNSTVVAMHVNEILLFLILIRTKKTNGFDEIEMSIQRTLAVRRMHVQRGRALRNRSTSP